MAETENQDGNGLEQILCHWRRRMLTHLPWKVLNVLCLKKQEI
jgi:hypothetical protein